MSPADMTGGVYAGVLACVDPTGHGWHFWRHPLYRQVYCPGHAFDHPGFVPIWLVELRQWVVGTD